jgi:alkanesulfonate monooxygenase
MADPLREPEVGWFSALCDDDYEFLGVPDPKLRISWDHCRDIVRCAENQGFDNTLLPSGYTLGIDATGFVAGIATQTVFISRRSEPARSGRHSWPVRSPRSTRWPGVDSA